MVILMFGKIVKYPLKSNRKQKIASVFGIFALFFGGILVSQSLKPAEAKGQGAKVLTVFENGVRTSFKTDAETVGQALKEQGFEISDNDNIEPSLSEKLTDTDYNVNIYRAAPYTIVDGKAKIKVISAAKTYRKIAQDAGVVIFDEDLINSKTPISLLEDGSTSVLEIIRAKKITVKFFGKVQEFRTQASTISDFLKEKDTKLTDKDELSVDKSTKLSDGDHFEIWRNGKQTITVDEEIPFEVEKIQDASKPSTFKEVREAGEKGQKTVTYEIEVKRGEEISRTKITEAIVKNAKKQVEVVGTKTTTPLYVGGGSKDQWLAESGISQDYWYYVDQIVSKESGWNPNATNKSSGACGLAQALPCSKVGGNGGYDPVSALQWMNAYVNSRYYEGSPYASGLCGGKARGWECAWTFWQIKKWY